METQRVVGRIPYTILLLRLDAEEEGAVVVHRMGVSPTGWARETVGVKAFGDPAPKSLVAPAVTLPHVGGRLDR